MKKLAIILIFFFNNACTKKTFSILPVSPPSTPQQELPSHQMKLQILKPALAIQNPACIFCHATIQGSVLTDFGLSFVEATNNSRPLKPISKFGRRNQIINGQTFTGALISDTTRSTERYWPVNFTNLSTHLGILGSASSLIAVPNKFYVPQMNIQINNPDQLIGYLNPPTLSTNLSFKDTLSILLNNPLSKFFNVTNNSFFNNTMVFASSQKNILDKIQTLAHYLNFSQNYRTQEYINFLNNFDISTLNTGGLNDDSGTDTGILPTPIPGFSKKLSDNSLPQPGLKKLTEVKEIKQLKFYFPSADDLRAAFAPIQPIKYLQDQTKKSLPIPPWITQTLSSPVLYTLNNPIECEGDLFIDGSVYLQDPIIKTNNGCRIYATGIILLYSYQRSADPLGTSPGIQYIPASKTGNLQLISSIMIMMGLGYTSLSNTLSDYAIPTDPTRRINQVTNSLLKRLQTDYLLPLNDGTNDFHPAVGLTKDPNSSQSTAYEYATAIYTGLLSRANLVANVFPPATLFDASIIDPGNTPAAFNQPNLNDYLKRKVSFDNVLLIAPHIESRYSGNISGTIITRFLLGALGSFYYSYSDVFEKIPYNSFLPFYPPLEKILTVEDCVCVTPDNQITDYATPDSNFPEVKSCYNAQTGC